MQQPLDHLVHEVAELLSRSHRKIVFAESCTAGLVSATLARVPGASNFHCGSAVVYRLDTKTRWLGVSEAMLNQYGAVSEEVARAMAQGALLQTPEAEFSAAITGHLGPQAPIEQDGLVYVGIAVRERFCHVIERRLSNINVARDVLRFPGATEREQRQWAAVEFVLTEIALMIRREGYCD